jgi:hypothetical protein
VAQDCRIVASLSHLTRGGGAMNTNRAILEVSAIVLVFLLGAGTAKASCSCQCMSGFMRLSCESPEDTPVGCLPTACKTLQNGGKLAARFRPLVQQGCSHGVGFGLGGDKRRVSTALKVVGCRNQALNSIKVDRINRSPVLQPR